MSDRELIHAVQLESAYQWFRANVNSETRQRNNTRMRWFVMMLRANCTICTRPLR